MHVHVHVPAITSSTGERVFLGCEVCLVGGLQLPHPLLQGPHLTSVLLSPVPCQCTVQRILSRRPFIHACTMYIHVRFHTMYAHNMVYTADIHVYMYVVCTLHMNDTARQMHTPKLKQPVIFKKTELSWAGFSRWVLYQLNYRGSSAG